MLEVAVQYFEQHPEAKACHVVLDRVFGTAAAASAYRKAWRASRVTAYTRKEWEEEVGKSEVGKSEVGCRKVGKT